MTKKTNDTYEKCAFGETEVLEQEEYEIKMIDLFDRRIIRGGYDALCKVLDLEFADGGIYRYFDVPEYIWYELRDAESMIRYVRQKLSGHFAVQKRLDNPAT